MNPSDNKQNRTDQNRQDLRQPQPKPGRGRPQQAPVRMPERSAANDSEDGEWMTEAGPLDPEDGGADPRPRHGRGRAVL